MRFLRCVGTIETSKQLGQLKQLTQCPIVSIVLIVPKINLTPLKRKG